MKIILLSILLFCLTGCDPQASFRIELDGGGVYNTTQEIRMFFEHKLNNGDIHTGMTQQEFRVLCGDPAERSRSVYSDGIREVWQYGNLRTGRYSYKQYLFVFQNGILMSWHE